MQTRDFCFSALSTLLKFSTAVPLDSGTCMLVQLYPVQLYLSTIINDYKIIRRDTVQNTDFHKLDFVAHFNSAFVQTGTGFVPP